MIIQFTPSMGLFSDRLHQVLYLYYLVVFEDIYQKKYITDPHYNKAFYNSVLVWHINICILLIFCFRLSNLPCHLSDTTKFDLSRKGSSLGIIRQCSFNPI